MKVKQHEGYNNDLQEVEKWLLQMSSRLVTPDLMENSNLEVITQQLANHKVRPSEKQHMVVKVIFLVIYLLVEMVCGLDSSVNWVFGCNPSSLYLPACVALDK